MSKKIFLKEGQIKLLKEYNCPDIVFLDHKTLKYTDNDAVTFFLHPIYGFCADSHITHSELIDDIIVRYMNIGFDYYTSFEKALEKEFEPEECRQLIDEFNELQDEFMSVEHITGRYWSNHDIISFWAKLPDEKSFNVIINELKLDMSTLRIALEYKIVNANEIYDKSDSEFIFNDKKQEQAKALHLMNAEEKANSPQMQDYLHNRSENIGKKLSYSNNGEMPMAQYRALHTTSESVEKDKYILGDEGCGNFNYTHIQESFGQNKYVDRDAIDKIEYFVTEPEDEGEENYYEIECFDRMGERIYFDNYLTFDDLWDVLGSELATLISTDEDFKSGEWNTIDEIIYNSQNDLDDSNVNAVNSFAKRFFQTSEEYLGNDRGYILTDGTILEFGPNMDHASISSVGNQTIGSFLSLGNIRIGVQSIELATEPTFAQRKQLRKLIQYNSNSEIYVDIIKYDGNGMYGTTLTSARYQSPTFNKVLGEIDRFFIEGIKLKGGDCGDEYDDIYENKKLREETSYSDKYELCAKLIEQGYLIHCTNSEYEKFDKKYIKGGSRAKEGYGAYFTDMPYKAIEYGKNIKLIKKENFNFLNSQQPIDKEWLLDGDIKQEIVRLEAELDNCRNIKEYDSINNEIEKLKNSLSDDRFIRFLDNVILRYDVKTYGGLEYNIPNPHENVPKLVQLYIDKGYDGYYTDGIYTIFNFDKLNQNLISYKGESVVNEDFKYETKEEIPNIVKLYHGTNFDAINDILDSGIISAKRSWKSSETKGVNWFSVDPNHKWGECLFSVEVPKEYFEYSSQPYFTLMNNIHVRTLDDIDIKQFNLSIVNIGGFDLESLGRLLINSKNDIYVFQQNLMETFGDRTNAFDFIDTPLMLQILKQLKGEDFIKQEGLIENIQYEVKPEEVDLSSFEKKKQLNPQIWKNENTIDSKVRLQLLDIADDFYDSLEVSFANPRDIILTGSICNYNWSDKSDIDLHIVLDFKEISDNTSLLEDYFNTKKNEWNQNHQNLQIFGFNVEVYVEDINAHKVSNGVYSLEKNEWIKKPNFDEVDDIKPMFQDLKILSSKLMTCIDDLKDEFNRTNDLKSIEDIRDTLDYIWDFIKIMRKESLNREGEYSKGNVIYKILRRNGYLDQIFSLSNDIYDKLNSIS